MGSSKTDQYSNQQITLAQTAKALGHPARIVILQHLSIYGKATNKQCSVLTGLSESTIVQHVKELRESGIISDFFVGRQHYIKLGPNSTILLLQLNKLIEFTSK